MSKSPATSGRGNKAISRKESDAEIVNEILSDPKRTEAVTHLIQEKLHIGPLPDPESLREYDQLINNGAERIMLMAENQSTHRIEIEKTVIKSREEQSRRGQSFAFFLAIFFGIIGLVLGILGHTYAAIAAFGLPVASIVTAFIKGKSKQT